MKSILLRGIALAIIASGAGCYCTACHLPPGAVIVKPIPPQGFVVQGPIYSTPPTRIVYTPGPIINPPVVQPSSPLNIPVPPTPMDDRGTEKIGPPAPGTGTSNHVKPDPSRIT